MFSKIYSSFTKKKVFQALLLFTAFSLSSPYSGLAQSEEEAIPAPFKHKYGSKHFTIYSISDKNQSKYYCDYLEDFLLCVNAHFAPISPTWRLSIYLYKDKKGLNGAERTKSLKENVMGFVSADNAIYSYDDAGLGTLSHEMMHKVVTETFKSQEPWAWEGIPAFFEKSYGYKGTGGSVLYLGYQNPWRLKDLGSGVKDLNIKSIFERKTSDKRSSDQRILAMFIAYKGKLPEYFYNCENVKYQGYKTVLEGTFQQTLEQLQPEFKKYLDQIYANETILMHIPDSKYFGNQKDYDKFAETNKQALQAEPLAAPYDQKYISLPREAMQKLYAQAEAAFKANQYKKCIEAADKYLVYFPKDLSLLNFRITCYEQLHDLKPAYAALAMALKLDPKSGEALTSRGILYTHQGRKMEALKDFDAAYHVAPGNASLNLNLAEALVNVGQYKRALPYLDVAAKDEKISGEPFYYRSVVLKKLGKAKESDDDLKLSQKLGYKPGSDTFYDPNTKDVLTTVDSKKDTKKETKKK